jgi:hypothetical protein
MKQTAVEQLVSELRKLAHDKNHHLEMGDIRISQGFIDELEEQAKEMEKQQQGYSEEDIQSLIKIRNYFGKNDKTFFEHFAYSFLDRIIKQFKNN